MIPLLRSLLLAAALLATGAYALSANATTPSAQSEINGLYRAIQNRDGPASIVSGYQSLMSVGATTKEQVAQAIIADSYTASYVTPVVQTFLGILGRTPDSDELQYWSNKLATGTTQLLVIETIAGSREFAAKYSGAMPRNSVTSETIVAFYNNVLGRTPSSSETAYWSNRANVGYSVAQILEGLLHFPELQSVLGAPTKDYLMTLAGFPPAGQTNTTQAAPSTQSTAAAPNPANDTPPSEEHKKAKADLLATVNDLIEQADDQIKEDGKTPRTYHEGKSPDAVKKKLADIKKLLDSAGHVSGLDGMATDVTNCQDIVASWHGNGGAGQGDGAAQNQIGAHTNAVSTAIQNQIGAGTPAAPTAAPAGGSQKFCYTVDGKQMCH